MTNTYVRRKNTEKINIVTYIDGPFFPDKTLSKQEQKQSKFNRKGTIICHFCKRLLWLPYPHTENFKQWNVEEVHKILKCYYYDNDLNEYKILKNEFEERSRKVEIRN